MKQIAIVLMLVMAACLVPATAITIPADDVGSYAYTTEKGYVIYKVVVDNLPVGSNQSHIFYYGGYPFRLEVDTWKENWGLTTFAKARFTYPNGSVQESQTYTSTLTDNYKTTIQPVFRLDSSVLESGVSPLIKVDLQIGLAPEISTEFNALPIIGYDAETAIPFKSASGQFSNFGVSDVYVYVVTEQEFEDTIKKYNPLAGIPDLGAAVFQWTWDSVIGFLNMIPVIGPYIGVFIQYTGIVIVFVSFWVGFMVLNAPAIVWGAEVLIMAFATINAPSGTRAFGGIYKNMYNYNKSLVNLFVDAFNVFKELVIAIVDLVTSVVNALKPL